MRACSFSPLIRANLAVLALAIFANAARANDTILVYAAASLTGVMQDLTPLWTEATGGALKVSLAGSSVLARQIQQGAPADVFISANADWMDVLEQDALIVGGTRRDLVGNTLALIAHDPSIPAQSIGPEFDLINLLAGGRLAMALVDAVPAGIYGKTALTKLGLWADLAPHVAQTDNVRTALALVASGAAPLGIVYATDAQAEPRVHMIGTFPETLHPAIRYPAAAINQPDPAPALAFLNFLQSDPARTVFAQRGFQVPGN
ncbi:molybdate ABC transporter substrate-binding protein (plasmid) [Rhodobacteraceae bacterium SC52]|nr:molybdate ABC transporter substrate-binding protein [Rhodobacteraceae bacterium SC52]